MKTIYPNDLVIYTTNPYMDEKFEGEITGLSETKISKFGDLSERYQKILSEEESHRNYSYQSEGSFHIRLDCIIPEYSDLNIDDIWSKIVKPLNSPLYKPNNGILYLNDRLYQIGYDIPKFKLLEGLFTKYHDSMTGKTIKQIKGSLAYEVRKRLQYKYIKYLLKNIKMREKILSQYKIGVNDKVFLFELAPPSELNKTKDKDGNKINKYKDDELIDWREFGLMVCGENHTMTPLEAFNRISYLYGNPKDDYEFTQEIYTHNNKKFIIRAGHTEFTEERYKTLSNNSKKEPVFIADFRNPLSIHMDYDYMEQNAKGDDEERKGTSFHIIPKDMSDDKNVKRISENLKKIYKRRNYKFSKLEKFEKKEKPSKDEKKKTEESKKEKEYKSRFKDLPKLGETPPKEKKKLCVMEKKTGHIFRGRAKRCHELVDSGLYSFCPEKFWKEQIYEMGKDNKMVIVSNPTEYDEKQKHYIIPIRTNITKSPTGREIGDKKKKKVANDEYKKAMNMATYGGRKSGMRKQQIRTGEKKTKSGKVIKPGVVEKTILHSDDKPKPISEEDRKKRSEEDRKRYYKKAKKSRSGGKKTMYYYGELIGRDDHGHGAMIKGKYFIKARSRNHAENKLIKLYEQKKKKLNLTRARIGTTILDKDSLGKADNVYGFTAVI